MLQVFLFISTNIGFPPLNTNAFAVETKVYDSQKILDKNNEFIKRLETKLECTICNDREKDTAIVPCGHTFCSHCIKDARYCFICRAFIIQPLKIYFN